MGIFSFFGGTAFRWLFGEVIGFFKAKQEHAHEIAMMAITFEQEKGRADLQSRAIKEAADANVRVVEAKSAADSMMMSDKMMSDAIADIGKPSGVKWIDGFNAFIRPELAQISIFLLVGNALFPEHVILTGVVLEVVCGVLGLFIGGRIGNSSSTK